MSTLEMDNIAIKTENLTKKNLAILQLLTT